MRHYTRAVSNLAQQHKDIFVVSLPHPLEYFHGFRLRPGLHERQQFADLVTLGLEDLVPAP